MKYFLQKALKKGTNSNLFFSNRVDLICANLAIIRTGGKLIYDYGNMFFTTFVINQKESIISIKAYQSLYYPPLEGAGGGKNRTSRTK